MLARRWLPFYLVLLCPVAVAAQSPDHDTLRRLKQVEWPRAYREQDTAALNRILADDFRLIGSDGGWSTKAEELEYIRSTKPSYDSLVFRVDRLDVYPNGTAIVAGTGMVYSRGAEGPRVMEYRSTNVLLKQAGRWRAVASHTSGNRLVKS